MAGITIEFAEERLTAYLAAEVAVLSNQSYEIAGRRLTRADLAVIQKGIELWDARCKALGAAATPGSRVAFVRHGW